MEHVALYRQFRPKDFDEIVEQKAAVATLRQTVLSNHELEAKIEELSGGRLARV